MNKKNNTMGLGLFSFGFLFLINPCINIIDVIPDFIGFILMAMGIDKLADMESRFARAKKAFVELAIIEAVKLASCALLPFIDSVFVILLVFSFALLEMIFFIPAVINLFEGFQYYGLRSGGGSVYKVGKSGKVEGLTALTVTAYSFRVVLALLPELPKLFTNKSTGVVDAGVSIEWTDFTTIFYVIACVVVLAVGIPCAVQMFRYIGGVKADRELMDYLCTTYNENIADVRGYFASKQMKAVTIMMIVGTVFCTNVYFDYVNWMPGGVAALLFAASVIVLSKNSKFTLPAIVSNVLWLAVSGASMYFQIVYASYNYKPTHFAASLGKTEVLYPRVIVTSVLDAVLMAVSVYFVARCLLDTLKLHTQIFEDNLPDIREGRAKVMLRELKRQFMPAFVLAMVLCVLYVAYPIVCVYYPEVWLLNLAVSLALLVCTVKALTYTNEELYDKLIGNF